jgi:chromosome partitioning protein
MRNIVTVMNAKGGVGKSTLVLALAETLAACHSKSVLVIDADAQASVSHLLARQPQLEAAQSDGRTIVDYLTGAVLNKSTANWRDFVIVDVSDVDDARTIALMPSDTELTLFEREVSKGDHESRLRRTIGACLSEAGAAYDIVLIDSAPGLSVLTECLLREAHFYLSPSKPDYISTRGLKFLREFRQRDPQMGFAENLGVIINMKDLHSAADEQFDRWLRQDTDLRCFQQSIPRAGPLQATGFVSPHLRSYWAKYPGEIGEHLRRLTVELLGRLTTTQGNALEVETAPVEKHEQGPKRAEGKMKAMWTTLKERRMLL